MLRIITKDSSAPPASEPMAVLLLKALVMLSLPRFKPRNKILYFYVSCFRVEDVSRAGKCYVYIF